MRTLFVGLLTIASLGLTAVPLDARPARRVQVDLAEMAQGVYHGDIMSDARGSSQSDVTISVDKTGPNTVRVTSDNERLPERSFRLTKAMQTIQNQGGEPGEVFLLDLSKSPRSLMLTVDDASWAGRKQ